MSPPLFWMQNLSDVSSFCCCLFAWLRLLKKPLVYRLKRSHISRQPPQRCLCCTHYTFVSIPNVQHTETTQEHHSCSTDIQPALSTLWTFTYLRFLRDDMGQMEVPDDWWITRAGMGEKMKSFQSGFFFLFPRLAGKDNAQMDILERGRWITEFKSNTT